MADEKNDGNGPEDEFGEPEIFAGDALEQIAHQGKQVVEDLTEWLGAHYKTLIAAGLGIMATGVAAYMLSRGHRRAVNEGEAVTAANPEYYH